MAADASSATLAPGRTFSSMKTSLIRPFTTLALTGAYDLDQSTTPEVVNISKLSSMSKLRLVNWSRSAQDDDGASRSRPMSWQGLLLKTATHDEEHTRLPSNVDDSEGIETVLYSKRSHIAVISLLGALQAQLGLS